MQTVPQILSYR